MTELQQLKSIEVEKNNTTTESTNLPLTRNINQTSKIQQLESIQTKQYEDDQDSDDQILINRWLGKYNSQQTQEQDDLDDQNEDDDIRKFLQQQVPGLYRANQSKSNPNIIKKQTQKIPQVIGLNSGSLCREYLGMSRWEKQSFFENLNQLYMQRMSCGDSNERGVHDKNKKMNKKRSIKFSEVIGEVVFNKQEQPIMVKDTVQQAGVIVFDDAAYQQQESSQESNSSSSSISSNSSSNSEQSQEQEFEIIKERDIIRKRLVRDGRQYKLNGSGNDEQIYQQSDEQQFCDYRIEKLCRKRVQYMSRLGNEDSEDELNNIYCEQSQDSNSNNEIFQQQESSSLQQQQSSSQQPKKFKKINKQLKISTQTNNEQTHQNIINNQEQHQERKFKRDIHGQLVTTTINNQQQSQVSNQIIQSQSNLINQSNNGRKIIHTNQQNPLQHNQKLLQFIQLQQNTQNTLKEVQNIIQTSQNISLISQNIPQNITQNTASTITNIEIVNL